MMRPSIRSWLAAGALFASIMATPALAQETAPLDDSAMETARGGLRTAQGLEIGFGASVKTYVDGRLALETKLTWTEAGAVSERAYVSDDAKALTPGADTSARGPVTIAPGAQVIHDLTQNRIAGVVLNTGHDRTIRQDADITLHLPQLPDLQLQAMRERIGHALESLSPQAAGLGK